MEGAPPRRAASVPFIMVSLFLATLGIGLVLPVMPKLIGSFLGGDLAAASRYYGGFIALYSIMQFICAPILGGLSDRFGRRKVLLTSQLGSSADYMLLALAPSLSWLFVGRIISGMLGASFSTGTAYIADITPPEKRAQNFGLVGAAFGLGFIIGPAVGGLLSRIDLRAPFFAASGLYLVNFLYGFFVLPESLKPENRRPMSLARSNPLGAFRNFLRTKALVGLASTLLFTFLAQQILQSVWVLYTQGRFGWSPFEIGISLAVVGLAAAFVQGGLLRVIMPRLGEQTTAIVGSTTGMIAFIALGLANTGTLAYVAMIPLSLRGITQPAIQALMTRHVPANAQGELQGSVTSLMSVTAMIGPLLGTRLFARFGSPGAVPYIPGMAYFTAAGLEAISLTLALMLFAKWKRLPPSEI